MYSQGTLFFPSYQPTPRISNTCNQRNPRPLLPRSSQRPTSQPRGPPPPTALPDLVNSKLTRLSSQTDSTRASDLELHIQRRVAAELERLSTEASQQLSSLSDSISATPDSSTEFAHPESNANFSIASGAVFASEKAGDRKSDLGRQSVQREIEGLKKKLQQRKIKEEVVGDMGVVAAKDGVVKCLRENDRRPLDCWREVEAFKREVGRLEKGFLGRVWD